MEFLAALWLPILLAAVAVFFLSSLMHMVLPFHKKDASKMPGEDAVLSAMRGAGIKPGNYFFPACDSMKDMATDEMKAKYAQGPVGHMSIGPVGPPAIGKRLTIWFVYSLVVGVLVAYASYLGLGRGAEPILVFRVTTTIALLPYGIAAVSDSIWKMVPWSVSMRFIVDGLVYAIGTGVLFAVLWPGV